MQFIRIIGVPSSCGSLYSGTDLAPDALRKAGLREALANIGFAIDDRGDLNMPAVLPKHNCAPIRNWPAPLIIWEEIMNEKNLWFNPEQLTLVIGGDCSIMVGTVSSFYRRYNEDAYLLILDAHIDNVQPDAQSCVGAAAMGVHLLTEKNSFWAANGSFPASHVTILGSHVNGALNEFSVRTIHEIKEKGARNLAQNYLARLPENAAVLLHLDVDVIDQREMRASYAPAAEGLTLQETKELLQPLLADSRIRFIEIAEFSGLRDPNGEEAAKLVNLLSEALTGRIYQYSTRR